MKGTPDQMAHINAEIQKLVDAMDIKVEVDNKPERRKYVDIPFQSLASASWQLLCQVNDRC